MTKDRKYGETVATVNQQPEDLINMVEMPRYFSNGQAVEILKSEFDTVMDDKVKNLQPFVSAKKGDQTIDLDGEFSVETLQALLAWMNK